MNGKTLHTIPANHPSLAGHFPDDPVVPGVVLLEEIVQALMAWRGECRLVTVPVVKFLAPLRPEQTFAIRFEAPSEHLVKFECTLHDRPLARGQLEIVT